MVTSIDIHKLTLEELLGVVSLYPWYGGARMELCRREASAGTLSEGDTGAAALHVWSRRLLSEAATGGKMEDYPNEGSAVLAGNLHSPAATPAEQPKKRIYVVGGDYFSQEQYDDVKREDDSSFSKFASTEAPATPREETSGEEEEEFDFCTETLAKIYLEQDYIEPAIDIYSKLSLRYPEKSVYFASLIEEIKQKNNNK